MARDTTARRSTARGRSATARSGPRDASRNVDTSTNYRAQYDVEKLTLHPAPGDARKEILFTRKGQTLYAILPLYPAG